MKTVADVIAALDFTMSEAAEPFFVTVGPTWVDVRAPEPLRAQLVAYFDGALGAAPPAHIRPIVVELLCDQVLEPEPAWQNWSREAGKAGRKDAIHDLQGARLIRKLRSGVTFLQSQDRVIAFGPLTENLSTVINFINTQILNDRLRAGWQLCHAAAILGPRAGLAIAGLSGGGKSTSVLRMMDLDGTAFMSNDRVLIRGGHPVAALGIPKQPRINPGTILGNARLHGLLSAERRAELALWPQQDLRQLEEKHDLMVNEIYGANRLRYEGTLSDFWVLNWQHDTDAPTRISPVDIATRPDLLGAIMKSPGPFYERPDGRFEPNGAQPQAQPYLDALAGLRVCEVTGAVDFDAIAAAGQAALSGAGAAQADG